MNKFKIGKKFISIKVYIETYRALIKKTPKPILIESPRDKSPLLVFLKSKRAIIKTTIEIP